MYQCSNHKNKFMQLELKCNYSNGLRELQKTNSRCWTIRLTMTPSVVYMKGLAYMDAPRVLVDNVICTRRQ